MGYVAHERLHAPAPPEADPRVGAVVDRVVIDQGIGDVASKDWVRARVLNRYPGKEVVRHEEPPVLQQKECIKNTSDQGHPSTHTA